MRHPWARSLAAVAVAVGAAVPALGQLVDRTLAPNTASP